MSKLSIALRLADETGMALAKAKKFVDDVGPDTARRVADDAAQAGDDSVSRWLKFGAGGTVVGGAGYLGWRQQEIKKAEALADQEQSVADALAALMDDNTLPAAVKRELALALLNRSSSDGDGGDEDGGGPFDDLLGDAQTTLVLVVVVALVLRYTLGEDD